MITAKEANNKRFRTTEELILSDIDERIGDILCDSTTQTFVKIPFPKAMVPSKGNVLCIGNTFDNVLLSLINNGYSITVNDETTTFMYDIPKHLWDFVPDDDKRFLNENHIQNPIVTVNIVTISWEDPDHPKSVDARKENKED